MNKKTELKFIKAIVKSILETDQRARNSDSYLYLKVIEYIAEQSHISLSNITILQFLNHMNDYGFPPFESVRRARQKNQAEYPELAASKTVADQRADNEIDYRNFVREGA